MKNNNKFLAIALLATTFSMFASCDDDDNTLPVETHEDAYGDVILKKMDMMGTIKYIPIFQAGGNMVNATGMWLQIQMEQNFQLTSFGLDQEV
jgi:hypothetical protein